MAEWWTYRLSDFLMFSARTWHRLFERYNADVWPAQIVTTGLGLAMAVAAVRATRDRSSPWPVATVFGLLALVWVWVGWAFHVQRYATINWAALWFGGAFVGQGMLLLGAAWRVRGHTAAAPDGGESADRPLLTPGLALLLFALVLQPLIGGALGRPWAQSELFGLAPDPTVGATLGLLLMLTPLRPLGKWSWSLWPLPLLWCVVAGATAWALDLPDAWLMPAVALLAFAALRWDRRTAVVSA